MSETEEIIWRLRRAFDSAKAVCARTGPVPCVVDSDDVERIIDRLTSPLLDPLPEGVEWVRRAPASVVRELGWEWWDIDQWRTVGELPIHYGVVIVACRPPQPPQVTVGDTTLPADASDDDIVAAFRAAGGVS